MALDPLGTSALDVLGSAGLGSHTRSSTRDSGRGLDRAQLSQLLIPLGK